MPLSLPVATTPRSELRATAVVLLSAWRVHRGVLSRWRSNIRTVPSRRPTTRSDPSLLRSPSLPSSPKPCANEAMWGLTVRTRRSSLRAVIESSYVVLRPPARAQGPSRYPPDRWRSPQPVPRSRPGPIVCPTVLHYRERPCDQCHDERDPDHTDEPAQPPVDTSFGGTFCCSRLTLCPTNARSVSVSAVLRSASSAAAPRRVPR